MRALTIEEWKKKAIEVHGKRYDYSHTVYTASRIKVKIRCLLHGVFEQTGNSHLAGRGCPSCGSTKPHTLKSFVAKASVVHGNRYDYSKVKTASGNTLVKILCPDHGIFTQRVSAHLSGHKCPTCALTMRTDTFKSFVAKARIVHGSLYDYSESVYINARTKLAIICKEHGVFYQTPNQHVCAESGCPQCAFHARVKFRRKIVKRAGKTFVLQGYEPQALDWLLTKVPVTDICHGKDVPTIDYLFSGKQLRYYPDFWIHSKSRIIEIKSVYTLGLLTDDQVFDQNKAKRKAAIAAGYDFIMLVFDRHGRKRTLPKNWWRKSKSSLKLLLERQCAI